MNRALITLLSLAAFAAISGYALATQPITIYWADIVALGLYAFTLALIINLLVDKKEDCIVLDLRRPAALFGLFYLIYYLAPGWITILADATAKRNSLDISAMTAAGLLCFVAGAWIARYRRHPEQNEFCISEDRAKVLLVMCMAGMALLVWYYAWKISIGQFYTHGGDYTQEKTVFAGLMQSGVEPLQLPIILLMGLVLRSLRSSRIRALFYAYVAASVLVFVLSSQFRAGVSAMLFAIASINISQRRPVKMRTYVFAGAVAAVMLSAILAIRAAGMTRDWSSSSNQLSDTASALAGGTHGNKSKVHSETFERMMNQPNFLSQIMDKISEGHEFLHGDVFWSLGYMLVPRFIWPGKPNVTPMQLLLRSEFDLPVHDDAAGPMLEFYANGGWLLVLFGFMGIGAITGKLTTYAAARPTLAILLVLCWWWSQVTFMEEELVLSMLADLRTILLVAVAVWLFKSRLMKATLYAAKAISAALALPILWIAAVATTLTTHRGTSVGEIPQD